MMLPMPSHRLDVFGHFAGDGLARNQDGDAGRVDRDDVGGDFADRFFQRDEAGGSEESVPGQDREGIVDPRRGRGDERRARLSSGLSVPSDLLEGVHEPVQVVFPIPRC